jgi:hypothetical protein
MKNAIKTFTYEIVYYTAGIFIFPNPIFHVISAAFAQHLTK